MANRADHVIIGAGVIGLAMALEAKRRHGGDSVVLLEKESACGLHASGRNSGVLHAGFYYTADSLKARFTRQGCQEMTDYCLERGLKINRCGKLVVTRNSAELETLDELYRRGQVNGVTLQKISEEEAREIEPRAKTHKRALFSPATASVDPKEVMESLVKDAIEAGVEIRTNSPCVGASPGHVRIPGESISAGYVINTAGLYADKLARLFGFARQYTILPFKGIYLYSDEAPGAIKTHIYPVPNLKNPFLGVHFTVAVDGRIKLGPTAIPAFWREHYRGLEGFRLDEAADILTRQLALFRRNDFGFRSLAAGEMRKYWKPQMARLAQSLATGVDPAQYRTWGTPGVRAQLFHTPSNTLEMDFLFQGDAQSFHVLNAVSPGFTCAFPFSRYLWDNIEKLRG